MKVNELSEVSINILEGVCHWVSNLELWEAFLLIVGIVVVLPFFSSKDEDLSDY
jgi:hypothetical protein